MAGKDTKQTESADSGKSTGKSTSVNFRISLNDLMVLGFNMLKSGFGLIQSLEKMMDAKFQELVDKGELKPEDAEKLKHDISQSISSSKQKFSDKVSGGVRSTLNTLNIATLEDLKSLETRLDTLLETVDTIAEKRSVSR
ncbi:MAG TPA: hypothetical protein PLV45_05360, partial [bacterium]|nr:hypothetical protein [bacterium]